MPEPVPIKWPIRVKDWGFEDKLIDSDQQAIASDLDDATIDELVDVANRGREAIELLRDIEYVNLLQDPDWDRWEGFRSCPKCNGIEPSDEARVIRRVNAIGHIHWCPLGRLVGGLVRPKPEGWVDYPDDPDDTSPREPDATT